MASSMASVVAPSQQPHQQPLRQQQASATTSQSYGGQQKRSQQMSCLYTKQKTQKRKKWNDGRLVLHSMGASLYDAHPPPGSGDPKLDECCLTRAQSDALVRQTETRLETDKFLVQVEGPWTVATAPMTMAKPNALVSQGMKKVITRKFRKPGQFVPNNPMQNQAPANRKRQRQPLQPGELQRRYYGDQMQQQAQPPPSGPPAWNQGLQQQQPPPHRGIQSNGGVQQQPSPHHHQQQGYPPQHQSSPFQPGQPNSAATTNASGSFTADQQHYNTTPQPPAHCQQQQPVAQPQPNSTVPPQSRQGDSFAGNKFNPNQFYGEDEELSQDEDDDDGLGWNIQNRSQAPRNPSPAIQNNGNPPGVPPTSQQPLQRNSPTPSGGNATGSAMPPREQEPTSTQTSANNANGGSNGNGAALSTNELLKLFGANPLPSTKEAEPALPMTSASPTHPTEQQDSFVLPPPAASDSSSDEESDDDDAN